MNFSACRISHLASDQFFFFLLYLLLNKLNNSVDGFEMKNFCKNSLDSINLLYGKNSFPYITFCRIWYAKHVTCCLLLLATMYYTSCCCVCLHLVLVQTSENNLTLCWVEIDICEALYEVVRESNDNIIGFVVHPVLVPMPVPVPVLQPS